MICGCERPLAMEDGSCLKCGHDAPLPPSRVAERHASGKLVDKYFDALIALGAGGTSDR